MFTHIVHVSPFLLSQTKACIFNGNHLEINKYHHRTNRMKKLLQHSFLVMNNGIANHESNATIFSILFVLDTIFQHYLWATYQRRGASRFRVFVRFQFTLSAASDTIFADSTTTITVHLSDKI